MRRFWPLLLLAVLAPVFLFVVSRSSNVEQRTTRIVERRDPQAMADQIVLEKEFEALTVYPGAQMTYYLSTSRSGGAAVSAHFAPQSPITWDELRAHYDPVFSKTAWQFDREKALRPWGDRERIKAVYCKDSFAASLTSGPPDDGKSTDYSIHLGAGNMKFDRCGE